MTTSTPKKYIAIARLLLKWFEQHKRDLPWRATNESGKRNAYAVWLAEIMLQQTQVATVIPYFQRWLQRFPTLQALAAAPLDDVLKQWEGLGYYSRARNFHKAAQHVVQALRGHMPDTVAGLADVARRRPLHRRGHRQPGVWARCAHPGWQRQACALAGVCNRAISHRNWRLTMKSDLKSLISRTA